MMPLSSEKEEADKPILVFNSFILLLAFSILSAILVYFLNRPFSNLLLNGNEVPMPLLLAGYILLNSPALMIEYIYLINGKSKQIMLYGVTIFSLQVLIVGLPPLFGYGLNIVLTGLAAVAVVKFIWLLFVLSKYANFRFDSILLREFIRFGTPLVLSTLLSSSARYIDGFIITSQFSPDDFAIFQYGARELPLALLLSNSLSMAMLPKLARNNNASPLAEFRSEVYRLNWLLFPVSALLLFTSHWFYPLIFNPQFQQSATIFNIYLLLVISRLLFPQTLITAKKMNNIIVKASLYEIIINVALSLVLAKTMGIMGVAYATLVAYLFEKIYLAIACKQRLKISLKQYVPLKIYFVSSVLLLAFFVLVEFILY